MPTNAAPIEILKAADVVGKVRKSTRTVKGVDLTDGSLDVSEGRVAQMVLEGDAELRKVASDCRLDTSHIADMQARGVPIEKVAAGRMMSALNNSGMQSAYQQSVEKFGAELAKMGMDPDIAKEITSGVGGTGTSGTALGAWTTDSGPWLYDLQAPSKKILPVLTPIRNILPRTKGVGTAVQYRTITGISGSDTGGMGHPRISMNEGTTENFRGVTLNRPKKINWATGTGFTRYRELGVSDDLTWVAKFASAGFEDLRGLIAANGLKAHMLGEEHMIVGGRNAATGGAGTLAAPGAPTLAARTAATGETALSGYTTNIYVKITALSHFGESAHSTVATVAPGAGQVVDVTVSTMPVGAMGFRVYVSTGAADPGDVGRWLQIWNSGVMTGKNYSGGNLFTLSGALLASGTLDPITDTGTSSNDDFDGIIPLVAANGGVSTRVNGVLTLDMIQKNLFLPMWDNYKADPSKIWSNSIESIRITDLVLGATGTPYRVTVNVGDENGITGGYRVSRLINKITGRVVDLEVHPDIEQGTVVAMSTELPFPNSEIPNIWEMKNVQDYMEIDWPVIQMSYDMSTFQYGALICYAPTYNGIIQGIQAS